jgi:hypothetical protein
MPMLNQLCMRAGASLIILTSACRMPIFLNPSNDIILPHPRPIHLLIMKPTTAGAEIEGDIDREGETDGEKLGETD